MLRVNLSCALLYNSGHVECVKWLLANRANPHLRDADDRTPLNLALEYQHEECAQLLQLLGKFNFFTTRPDQNSLVK